MQKFTLHPEHSHDHYNTIIFCLVSMYFHSGFYNLPIYHHSNHCGQLAYVIIGKNIHRYVYRIIHFKHRTFQKD